MARSRRVNTAMSAVYAGPLLDILVAIPTGVWVLRQQAPRALQDVALTAPVATAGAVLIVHGLVTLVVARVNQGFLPRWYSRVGMLAYGVYLVAVVALLVGGTAD